ncbi:MAG TPA: hypothetical protein EYP03_05500 [Aquificae bacterium]|nr:hypothetical protein [Aquificota bacterium]
MFVRSIKYFKSTIEKLSILFLLVIATALLIFSAGVFFKYIFYMPHLINEIQHVLISDPSLAKEYIRKIISEFLLFALSVEVVILLVRHEPRVILDVLFIAISREVIVQVHSFVDMLLGVISIAILFFIRKYLRLKYKKDGKTYEEAM